MTTSLPPDDDGPGRWNMSDSSDSPRPGTTPSGPADPVADRSGPPDDPGSGGAPFTIGPDGESDIDAEFSAIVSGISGQMHWGATSEQLDARADEQSGWDDVFDAGQGADLRGSIGSIQRHPSGHEGADERRLRRELRRAERAESLRAHVEAEAERAAELAADDAHFVPPPPPPLPRPRRRTVAALLLIVTGIALLAWPGLLATAPEVEFVLAALLILGGGTMLITGLYRRRRGGDADGWDDGAVI